MLPPWCINPLEVSAGMAIEEITSLHYLWRSSGLAVHYAIWKQHVAGISKAMTAAEGHIFFQYHCFEGRKMSPF